MGFNPLKDLTQKNFNSLKDSKYELKYPLTTNSLTSADDFTSSVS